MATANPVPTQPKTTTAEDTLQRKSREAGVVSGGHLVAKALKNEGVDTIFTLCGGHIIDIYDGCVDEGIRIIDVRHEQVAAHAADGYARQTGKLGCVVTTAGPGCTNAVTGIATAFRSESPVLHIGGQGALTPAQDGLAAGPAARRHDVADHQVRRHRAEHRAGRRHDLDGGARGVQRRPGPGVPGDSARRARSRGRPHQGGRSEARPLPRLDALDRRSARHREARRHPGECRAARRFSTASRCGPRAATKRRSRCCAASTFPATSTARSRGLLPPGDPHHFDRTRGQAFANADVIVIVGTPFDFRMGYGRRISNKLKLVQIDMDYRTVGKNRDIDLGLVGDPGAILGAVLQAATGPAQAATSARRASSG